MASFSPNMLLFYFYMIDLANSHFKYINKCKLQANKEKEQREKCEISKIYAKISSEKEKNCKTSSELIVEVIIFTSLLSHQFKDYRSQVTENTKYFNFSVFDGASPTKISGENQKMMESTRSPLKFEEQVFSPSKKI